MGIGFAGGSWNGGHFAYNTAIVRVNPTIVTNVYVNRTIVEQTTIVNVTNVSYNGGPNGVQHQPTVDEQVAIHETHTPPTTFQMQHRAQAATNKGNFASANGGHPQTLAETKPLAAEKHDPPAGFKPPPPKPASELAKAQASPSTVEAAKTATAKTATVAKPAEKPVTAPPAKTAPAPKTMPKPAAEPAPKPEPKPVAEPAPKTTPKPMAEPAPKTTPKPETKPAPKSTGKPPAKDKKDEPK
jgi:hypothetical protein